MLMQYAEIDMILLTRLFRICKLRYNAAYLNTEVLGNEMIHAASI